MIFRKYEIADSELINFFIETIQKYISENSFRREHTLPYRKTIHLLEKMFFPSEDKRLHSAKIINPSIQYYRTFVNRHKTERHLKCDYCDFSFKYMIHTKKTKRKLWIPPLQ